MPVQVERVVRSGERQAATPVLICLLGSFQVLAGGRPVVLHGGRKAEALLSVLALRSKQGLTRERLLDSLWPDGEPALAGQWLNTLVYSLHRLLGPELGGAPPVVFSSGWYRLNLDSGLDTDLARLDDLAATGDRLLLSGERTAAADAYREAVDLYRGELCAGTDVHSLVERERVRVRYLNVLAQLADHHFSVANYAACLETVLRLLSVDGCREDAHRLAMRCHVRRGERAQALRQYRLCESILAGEFDAPPEPATHALFERVRLDPDSV